MSTLKTPLLGLVSLTNEEYHASAGYSASDIIAMADGFDYWVWKKKQPHSATGDKMIGSLTHLCIEEALTGLELFKHGVIVLPEGKSYRTKAFDEAVTANPGKIVIAADDVAMCKRMADAVLSDPDIGGYFRGGISEQSVYVRHPDFGVLMKTRPDYLRPQDGLSINLKTATDASYEGFVKSVRDWRYDFQSAYYCETLKHHYQRDFDELHVVVQKPEEPGAPIRIGLYTIDDEDLDFARAQYRQILEKIPMCEETGVWPAPPNGLQTVKLPGWARKVVTV